MKKLILIISITISSLAYNQEIEISDSASILNVITMDSTVQDSAMMSANEIYDYYYIKKFKLPQCLKTADTLQIQIQQMDLQIQDMELRNQQLNQAFLHVKQINKEKDLQLKIEETKSNKKTWGIIGGVVGGFVTGFIVGYVTKK